MDDVVAGAVSEEVPQRAGSEHKGLVDAAAALRRVEPHTRRQCDYAYTGNPRLDVLVPLHARQVRDVVPLGGQAFGELAVPPLSASMVYGVRQS